MWSGRIPNQDAVVSMVVSGSVFSLFCALRSWMVFLNSSSLVQRTIVPVSVLMW